MQWFEKKLFGRKSEKRLIVDSPKQNALFDWLGDAGDQQTETKKQTITYQRGTAKKNRPEDSATEAGLRFTHDVPIEVVLLTPPELMGSEADQYEIVDTKVSHKLAAPSQLCGIAIRASRDQKERHRVAQDNTDVTPSTG